VNSKIPLLLYVVALLVNPSMQSQDEKGSTDKYEEVTDRKLQPWVLERKARIARAFQYQFGLQEQPGTVTVQNGSAVTFVPNPEHYLVRHSLNLQLSEFFLPPSDFGSALKSFHDNEAGGKTLDLRSLCGKRKQWALECVATSGAWWQRALSGVKGTFSLSERTRVVSGIVVPDKPFPQGYDKAGEIDFDPTQLFILGSNWKGAAASLAGIRVVSGNKDSACFPDLKSGSLDISQPDLELIEKCIREYGGSKRGGIGFLAAAVPTFKFVRQTQFDFLKNGGALLPAPFPEPALNSYSFTWDLRRMIAPTKERVAVTDTIKATHPSTSGTKLCVTLSNGQKSFMPISDSFPESSCERFAQGMSNGQFVFACVAQNGETSLGDDSHLKPVGGNCKWSTDKLVKAAR
jgi:hypothetical protein